MIPCILTQQNLPASAGSNYTLISLEITSPPDKLTYASGSNFDKTGMVITANYGVDGIVMKSIDATENVNIEPMTLTDGVTNVKIFLRAADGSEVAVWQDVTVRAVPVSLEIAQEELEIPYYFGDSLPATVKIHVTYSDGSVVERQGEVERPQINSNTFWTGRYVYYTEEIAGTTTRISSGAVWFNENRAPIPRPTWKNNLVYTGTQINVDDVSYWNNWDKAGCVLTGVSRATDAGTYTARFYLNGKTNMGSGGRTVFYEWEDTHTGEDLYVEWTIEKAPVDTVPSQTGGLTYNGSPQSPTWNNFDPTLLSLDGQTEATNAGTYTARFVPTQNYRWSDGSEYKEVQWTIAKADRTITVSPSSVVFDKDHTSYEVTLSYPISTYKAGQNQPNIWLSGSEKATFGSFTYTDAPDGGTKFLSGGTIRPADTSTNFENYAVNIVVTGDDNYLNASVNVIASANFGFQWGAEAAYGNAAWWAKLKDWITTGSTLAERQACVGKQKTVVLGSAILGTTSHLVRCIGADQDGANTLTFQTSNCLARTTVWSSAAGTPDNYDPYAAIWANNNCLPMRRCQEYYESFPGSASIKTVRKGTVSTIPFSANRTDTEYMANYRNETVWLPSELEMGLDSYSMKSVADSTATNAENTYGIEPKDQIYSYYKDNATRIKKLGDSGRSATQYWERSRCYGVVDLYDVCLVNSDGSAGSLGYYWEAYGLAPAFTIG